MISILESIEQTRRSLMKEKEHLVQQLPLYYGTIKYTEEMIAAAEKSLKVIEHEIKECDDFLGKDYEV